MDANCSEMKELSSSKLLVGALIYNLVFSILAAPLLSWASYKLWNGSYTRRFHVNTRILAQFHLFGFFLHCYGRIVLHSLDLYNYFFLSPCDMVPHIIRCFIFRFAYNVGMWIPSCTVIPMAIERCIATWQKSKYESWGPGLGILLIVVQTLIAAIPISLAYSNTKFDGVFMPYCLVYKPGSPLIANINGITAIVFQITARIIFSVLFRLNKKYRENMQASSLAKSYQIEQNKNSMECLQVYANLSTTFLVLETSIFAWLFENSPKMAHSQYLGLMELTCAYPLYGILTVLIVLWKIHKMRIRTRVLIVQQKKSGTNMYRENLEKTWKVLKRQPKY